jgi:hypothetical protein
MLGRGYGKRAFIVAWLINHSTGIARMLAWMGILTIIILSVVPGADRPVTGAGQLLEKGWARCQACEGSARYFIAV